MGGPGMMDGPGMGGQTMMIQDANFLFVLRGDMVFKINKANMHVDGVAGLPRPGMPPMQPGGFGGGGGTETRPARTSGGGTAPLPSRGH